MRKSFLTDWLQTFLTEAFITILGIIILKLFAHLLVEADFGVYLILRRSIMLLMPVVSLNLSLSLARFINLNKVNGEVNYLKSIRIITFLALLFLIISIAFKSEISFILFNSHDYTSLIIPLVILTYVTSIHWIATGYFRGNQKFSQMNLLLIVYWLVTIFGMSILIWIPTSETIFLSVYFYLCSGILFLYNLYMMKSILITRLSREKIRQILLGEKITSDFKKIINYGLKRLPQGFLLSILFFCHLSLAQITSLWQMQHIWGS